MNEGVVVVVSGEILLLLTELDKSMGLVDDAVELGVDLVVQVCVLAKFAEETCAVVSPCSSILGLEALYYNLSIFNI